MRSPNRPLPGWLSVLVVVAAVVLVLVPGSAREVESVGTRLFRPVQMGVSGLLDALTSFSTTVGQIGQLAAENAAYREQIDRLQSELVRMAELEQENEDLRNLLGLKQRAGPGELIPVRVIGSEVTPFVQAITIDRGAEDGIGEGMTIVTWRGLVGRVVKANPTSAKVLLITDPNNAIAARIQDPASRATGVVRGLGPDGLLMEHIRQEDRVQTGQLVITSGLGGVYPEGLIVGTVVRVQRKDVDVFQSAVVEPAVDFSKLERVYALQLKERPAGE